ncbi:mucin-binding protein [Ligilactobacillus acidipiscis]|uniref:mucin-binding protein n=1 Tax=Ligilactobacillus acidipiscis TaxID=89059 RepID=UPI0023F764AF|nr:KxYKxGKxW signal peptide domain-containing protein [Ligilactobacillus acidipiscis]WEV56637.1 KxYKxGKxW signal peptide domain-containing protein [Ligilactobacillus acidipiscis]
MKRNFGELKEHYKMYKSGKHWVYVAIAVFSFGIGGISFPVCTTVSADVIDNSISVASQKQKTSKETDPTRSQVKNSSTAVDHIDVAHPDLDAAVNDAKNNGVEVTQDPSKDKTVTEDNINQAKSDISHDYAVQTNKVKEANKKQEEKNQQFAQDKKDAVTTNSANKDKVDQAVKGATAAGATVTHDAANDKITESNITNYDSDKAIVNSDNQANIDKINTAKNNAEANKKVAKSSDSTNLDQAIEHAKKIIGEENITQGKYQDQGQVTAENADQVASNIKNDYAQQVKLIDDQLNKYQKDKAARDAYIDNLVREGDKTQSGEFITNADGWFDVTLQYTITYHFDKNRDTYLITDIKFNVKNESHKQGGAGFNDAVIAHAPGGDIPKDSGYFNAAAGDINTLNNLEEELSKDKYKVIYGYIQNNKNDDRRVVKNESFIPYEAVKNADGSYTLLEFYNRIRGQKDQSGHQSYAHFSLGNAVGPAREVPVLNTPTIKYHYDTYTEANTNVSYSNHRISVAAPKAERVNYHLNDLHSVPATKHLTTNRTIHYIDKQTGNFVAKDVVQTINYDLTAISDQDKNFMGYDIDGDGIADTQNVNEAWVLSGGLAAVTSPDLTAKGYAAPDKAIAKEQIITVVNGELNDSGKDVVVLYDHQLTTVTPEKPGQPRQPIDPQNPDILYPEGTGKNDVSRTVAETVRYQYEDGSKAADTHTDKVIFNREIVVDKVTGQIVRIGQWQAANNDTTFDEVISPVISGYYTETAKINQVNGLVPDSADYNYVVTYKPLGSLVPSSNDPNFPDPGNTKYPNDPQDPTSVGKVTVPDVPGYAPYIDGNPIKPGTVLTPDDPTRDTTVVYVKNNVPQPVILGGCEKPSKPAATAQPTVPSAPERLNHMTTSQNPRHGVSVKPHVSKVKVEKYSAGKTKLPQTGEKQNKNQGLFATALAFMFILLGILGFDTNKRNKNNN